MEVTQEELVLLQQALWDRATGKRTYNFRDRRAVARDFLPMVDWSGRTRFVVIQYRRDRRRRRRRI